MSQIRRLFVFARPYRGRIIAATVAVAFASGLGLVFPRIMGDLVDSALGEVGSADTSDLDRFAIILVFVFLAQAGFNFLRSYWLAIAGEGVVADLRRAVFARVVRLGVPFFDERKTGEITSRLTADAAVVQSTVSSAVAQALAQAITLIGSVILLFLLSARLSLTVLTFVPVVMIAAAIFGRRLRRDLDRLPGSSCRSQQPCRRSDLLGPGGQVVHGRRRNRPSLRPPHPGVL